MREHRRLLPHITKLQTLGRFRHHPRSTFDERRRELLGGIPSGKRHRRGQESRLGGDWIFIDQPGTCNSHNSRDTGG